MLRPLLFYNFFRSWNKEGKYKRYYMIAFLLLWVVTSKKSYSSMKDKYPTFYASSSWVSQHNISMILKSRRWNKKTLLYVIFVLVNHQFSIKEVTRNIADNYVSTFVILQMFWVLKQRGKIYHILYFCFYTILGCHFHIYVFFNIG